jgi:hypothetical protein
VTYRPVNPNGQATMANSEPVVIASNQTAIPVSDGAGSLTVDGTVTANAGTNLNTSALALETGGNLAAATTSLSVIDDWDETDRAKVNSIVGQAGVAAGAGAVSASTQRVVIVTDQTAIPITDNAGSLTVDGTVAVSSITTSITPGTGASNLGKAEDAAHTTGDVGVMALAVAQTSASSQAASGDYVAISADASGRVRVIGSVAQDAALGSDVVTVGGRASAAVPSSMSADGDAVFAWLDRNGRQVITQKAGTATLSNVSGSASSVTVLAANTSRLGATVYNDSTAILYLKFGATASTTSFTAKLNADDYYEVPYGYTGILDGIWASATGSARVTEIT